MNAILGWLTSPEWAQVVKTLLHSLWQAGLVALVLGLLLRRIASPSWRYRFALGSLGGVLIAAVVSWAVLNQLSQRPETFPQTVLLPDASLAEQGSLPPDPTGEPIVFRVAATKQTDGDSVKAGWTAWLALVWILGALAMVVRAGVQVAGAERLRRSCKPLADERVLRLLEEAQRAMKLARRVRVAVTDKLTSPAVVGVLVPTLILPLTLLTALTPEQLRFVLLHELAHIRRGDYFANLFQLFMEALLFFNPAVWWISHLVRREREACCDALAIELSGAPVDYAKTLVQVAENVLSPAPAAATAFGDGQREPSSLSDRVQRLLVPGYRPALRLTWRAMLAALLVGGALLFLSALGARNVVGAVASNATETASAPLVNTNSTPSDHRLSRSQTADMVDFYLPAQSDTFSGGGMHGWNVEGENGLAKQWFWYRTSPGPAVVISTTNNVEFPLSRYATTSNAFVDSTSLSLDDLKGQPLVLYVDSGKSPPRTGESVVNDASGGERPIETSSLATRTHAVGRMELARALGMTGSQVATNAIQNSSKSVEVTNSTSSNQRRTSGRTVTLTDGASTAQVDPDSEPGVSTWTVDGLDQLYEKWFWYHNNRGLEQDFFTPSLGSNVSARPQQSNHFQYSDNDVTNYVTRDFKLDLDAVAVALGVPIPTRQSNETQTASAPASGVRTNEIPSLVQRLRDRIRESGVDLNHEKSAFYLNLTKGLLRVRATMKDLDAIEALLRSLQASPLATRTKSFTDLISSPRYVFSFLACIARLET